MSSWLHRQSSKGIYPCCSNKLPPHAHVQHGLITALSSGLIAGMIFGLIFRLRFGGLACIQHYTLRFILYRNGHIPWNYVRFPRLRRRAHLPAKSVGVTSSCIGCCWNTSQP
jgi:hypothetical protein